MRRAGFALLFATLIVATMPSSAKAPDGRPARQPPNLVTLYHQYQSGDYDAVVRALPNRNAFNAIERELERTLPLWRKDWRRVHAVFLLEIVTVAFRQSWSDRAELLDKALKFLDAQARFPAPGSADGMFEVLWHRAALAILQGALSPRMMLQYLDQVEDRIGPTPRTFEIKTQDGMVRRARLVDERLALVRAMAQEMNLLPGVIQTQMTMSVAGSRTTTRIGGRPSAVTEILARLDEASAFDVNRVESAVRRANVLIRTNRAEDALPFLDAYAGPLPDKVLQYWRDVLRGRALDMIDRLGEAAVAYSDARGLAPQAQSPILALGVLRFRQGNTAEALQLTDAVRQLPPDGRDPWNIYWFGDSRFFPNLLTALRELAK